MEDKMDLIRSAKIQLDTDKAMIVDKLLKKGWTSTLDIAIEVNKQTFYNESEYGTGIAYFLKYLLGEKEKTILFNNRNASKLIHNMNKTWVFVRSSLNNDSINKEVSDQFIKTVKVQFKDEDSFKESDLKDDTIMVYYKKTKEKSPRKKNASPKDINTDEDLYKKKLIEKCDEKLLQYNLSPETMLLINYMKELLKANFHRNLKDINNDEKKREEEEALRIMNNYHIKKEDWPKVIDIKSTNHFNIYIYSNPNCSFLEDWTRYQTIKEAGQIYDKSAPRKRKISDRHNQINMAPPSGALHRTIQFESYKDLLLQQANANIGEVKENIKRLEEDKPNGWIDTVADLYENEVLIDYSFVKQYGVINEKEIDLIVDRYVKHVLNHIKMDYISLILKTERFSLINTITELNVNADYYKRLNDLTTLLDTDYITVDKLNSVWICCNDLKWLYFRLDKNQQQALSGFEHAIINLKQCVSYIVPMCKIELLMKTYRYNLVPIISKIIYPINEIIIQFGGINWGKYICDEARRDFILVCKEFIVKLQRKSQDDNLMVCMIGMLLAYLDDNYPEFYDRLDDNNCQNANPYNIDPLFINIFESESIWNHFLKILGEEVWTEIVALSDYYRWEQDRRQLMKYLCDNKTPEDIDFHREIIPFMLTYMFYLLTFRNNRLIRMNCCIKLLFDLKDYIETSKILHLGEKGSDSEKILLIASYVYKYLDSSSIDDIVTCKIKLSQVLEEANSIDFNNFEMNLIYFLASFKLIDTIRNCIANKNEIKRNVITEIKDWLKSNLIDNIEVIYADFTQEIIEKIYEELDYLVLKLED